MILVDVFPYKGDMILWCYDEEGKNRFFKRSFQPTIYYETFNENFSCQILKDQILEKTTRKHMDKGEIELFKVTFRSVSDFKRRFRLIEKKLRGVGKFYNADLPIEEMFFFEHDLYPLAKIDRALINIDDRCKYDYELPKFRIANIQILPDGVEMNKQFYRFPEFKKAFLLLDPDIIYIHKQQRDLLELCSKLKIRLNRVGPEPFLPKKGYSYFSYGITFYRESPIYLKGRLLINSSGFLDDSFNVYSVLEGARICRMSIQRLSTHSVGAAITSLLSWQAYHDGYLIPYKSGFYEKIKPFRQLIDVDRGAFTLEPYTGLHKEVAELDFVSMFPSIISRYNLSPETFDCDCCKDNKVAGTGYHFCKKKKGVVGKVCEYLMDRRARFKSRRDNISRSKVEYLKWLLVVIFGFQGCRHKKIGRIEVHETINAVARETMLKAIKVAERHGYTVIHGIVDSLYVKKKGINKHDLRVLVDELNQVCRITIEYKGMFRFLTFLPSVNAGYQPVPTSYYGVSKNGDIKVRGIGIRQRSCPKIVKSMQKEIIEEMGKVVDEEDVGAWLKRSIPILRNHIEALSYANPEELSMTIRVSKERYKVNCVQKIVTDQMKKLGKTINPGQSIKYIIVNAHRQVYTDISEYKGFFDRQKYVELLKKGLIHLFLPFGADMQIVDDLLANERQVRLSEYCEKAVIVA